MKRFLQFLRESLADAGQAAPKPLAAGSFWYNSKTGQTTHIAGNSTYAPGEPETPGPNGLLDSTYHAGFVVKNLNHFGITPEELHDNILKFENPQQPDLQTAEGRQRLAKKRVEQLATGYSDTNPGVDSLVMSKGWVRGHRNPLSLWLQGKAPALFKLARHAHHTEPKIGSIHMDVHGAAETYGHLDPTIQAMAHVLEGRDQIQDFVERGGAPHKSYTRIVRVKPNKP